MTIKKDQEYVDAIFRHHTYIDRFGSGLANRVSYLFDDEELFALVMSKRKFRRKIEALLSKDLKRAKKLIFTELRQMAVLEVEFLKQLSLDFKDLKFNHHSAKTLVDDVLMKDLVVGNVTISDMYDQVFDRKEQIATTLNSMGNLDIKDAATINSELIAMTAQFARGLEAVNKTFTFAVANDMREKAYQKSDAVERVVMSAVLDGRTTPYCMNIDGEIFDKGVGPRPPFHIRCRTIAIPVLEGQTNKDVDDLLSYRAQVGPGSDYEKGESKELRSHKAQINSGKTKVKPAGKSKKSSSNYADFLYSQRNSKTGKQFIEDVLGIKKGRRFLKLIKSGKSPDKALSDVLYQIKANELDIDGLKKRVSS